ncbi:MAG: hypothetical protein ACE5J1_04645 [Nitrospiria bacterium]
MQILFTVSMLLLPVVFLFVIAVFLFSTAERPLVLKRIFCPIFGKEEDVWFFVNVFKDPKKKGGLDVKTCSEFSSGQGDVHCEKRCLSMKEVQALHQSASELHSAELAK